MSQDDLARAIRDAGRRTGEPDNCTRRVVQRWEAGLVTTPRGTYTRALEYVMGQPAENLGFIPADERYGLDRETAMTMPEAARVPGPKTAQGPLSGIWLSPYECESSGRGQTFADLHHGLVLQHGDNVQVRSLAESAPSDLVMDRTQNGAVLTGTWTERANPRGYYQGSAYHGAIQLLLEPSSRRRSGKRIGFGRDRDVNVGPWTLTLVTADTAAEAIKRYSRTPEPAEAGPGPREPA
jgi:hypothetical protein